MKSNAVEISFIPSWSLWTYGTIDDVEINKECTGFLNWDIFNIYFIN